MSDNLSRKRGGEALNGNPPEKIAAEVLNSSESVDYDVTIIVDGQRFNCSKEHLGQNSGISLAKQFEMAETYHSEKLMTQVLSCVEDANQLDEVVPKNLDSFCNTTKNIVLQRSFELLGIRKLSASPLPEKPDQVFEHMMNQIIDQVEIQHHHGEILENQSELLFLHSFVEEILSKMINSAVAETIRDNHHIKELADELRDAHEPQEINFIQAQILVLKCKDIYTAIKDIGERERDQDRESLDKLNNILLNFLVKPALLICKNKRSHRSFRVTLGDRDIDEIYRDITGRAVRESQKQHFREITGYPSWIEAMNLLNNVVSEMLNVGGRFRKPIPDGVRQVSNRADFWTIHEFMSKMRCYHYGTELPIQPEDDDNENEEGPDHDENDQHQEQDQD
ncbi:hypothetical protein CAEBREN_11921 [Caenorhabditis brenneri]|uniref:Uncharacterized protein n=1 Tax=Caenorhabditis brenneri TaxID=135651 RepID=G0NP91_CAEBE|nr:hypothetical protein CAEBREN_11921 [Caenorhabditis brenneri]